MSLDIAYRESVVLIQYLIFNCLVMDFAHGYVTMKASFYSMSIIFTLAATGLTNRQLAKNSVRTLTLLGY
jgi:hypothetical protein